MMTFRDLFKITWRQGSVLLPTIAVLLSCVRGQVLLQGSCPPVPVLKHFSPEKFLGTWYELERYYSDFQVNTKCNKLDFASSVDGRINIITSAIQEKSGMPKISYGLANLEHGESARMTISMRPTTPDQNSKDTIPPFDYWVLETDYESYAVIYSCNDVCRGRQHTQTIWILGRTALIPSHVLNRLYDKIKILGLDPKRLTRVDQSKCVNVAVSVRSENSSGPSSNNSFDRNSARKFLSSLIFGRQKFKYAKSFE